MLAQTMSNAEKQYQHSRLEFLVTNNVLKLLKKTK